MGNKDRGNIEKGKKAQSYRYALGDHRHGILRRNTTPTQMYPTAGTKAKIIFVSRYLS
jgi:hypothetical protein